MRIDKPLVVTAGEPAGVGPELCLTLAHEDLPAEIVVVGDPDTLEQALLELQNTPVSQWQTPARAEFLKRHTREVLAGRMFEILDGM